MLNEYEADFNSETTCLFCDKFYLLSRFKETWIWYQKCRSLCQFLCAGTNRRRKKFICELCL